MKASAFSGRTPDFCGSPPVLTSTNRRGRLPALSISRASAAAIFSRSTVSMTSKVSIASRALLLCSGPIRCNSIDLAERGGAGAQVPPLRDRLLDPVLAEEGLAGDGDRGPDLVGGKGLGDRHELDRFRRPAAVARPQRDRLAQRNEAGAAASEWMCSMRSDKACSVAAQPPCQAARKAPRKSLPALARENDRPVSFCRGRNNPMTAHPEWKLGLINSAWFGSPYEGQPGREEAKKIGFDSLDLFIGFDPGRMAADERRKLPRRRSQRRLADRFAGLHLPRPQRFQSRHPFLSYRAGEERHRPRIRVFRQEPLLRPRRVHVPASPAAGGGRVEARGRRDAAGRTACRRTGARACDRAAPVRLRLHQDAGRYGAFPGRRRPRERQGHGGHLAFLADAHSAALRSIGSTAGSPRFTSPIATGSITATCRRGGETRPSASTCPRSATRASPARRRSNSNFRRI